MFQLSQIVNQAVQPVFQQQPMWGMGGNMWAMQQNQQQQNPFQQAQMPQQSVGQFYANVAPPPMAGQQWCNLPAGFPILVPGPGGTLVPAGSIPPPKGDPPQDKQLGRDYDNILSHYPQQQNMNSRQEGEDDVPEGEDLPAGGQAPVVSTGSLKMNRLPTKRFVIGRATGDSKGK